MLKYADKLLDKYCIYLISINIFRLNKKRTVSAKKAHFMSANKNVTVTL